MIPDFYFVGMPRTSSTYLYHILKKHPQVFLSKVKESHFFSNDINHYFTRDRKKFLNLYEDNKRDNKLVGDFSVWYYISDVAVKNILNEKPNAKFILFLRSPYSFYRSMHGKHCETGMEDENDPFLAFYNNINNKKRKYGRLITDKKLLDYKNIISLYDKIINLKKLIKEENLYITTFEEFTSNPKDEVNKVCNFLNIPKFSNLDITNKINSFYLPKSIILNYLILYLRGSKYFNKYIKLIYKKDFDYFSANNKFKYEITEILKNFNKRKFVKNDSKLKNLIEDFTYDDIKNTSNILNKDLFKIFGCGSRI